MRGKRHSVIGAAVALLTLLAALLCVTSASPGAKGPATAASVRAAVCHDALGHSGQGAPGAVADAPCLKKTLPEQRQPSIHASLTRNLLVGNDVMESGRALAHGYAPRRTPAESPPDLAELSVRRV
ncbi:hypothetical protein [Streptomyces sp. NPDC086766]|uniref:hypothetical protein n=1 Tax=Streptomyces sp. NPDC086766 TaxID=3365754 RepID=UPI00382F53BA